MRAAPSIPLSSPLSCPCRSSSWSSACCGARRFRSPSWPWRIVRRCCCLRRAFSPPASSSLELQASTARRCGLPGAILRSSAALGVVNQAIYLGVGYIGMQSVSSGLSALIISANPVLTAVMAAAFLDERMTWRKASASSWVSPVLPSSWKTASPSAPSRWPASVSSSRRWSRWSPARSCSSGLRRAATCGSATACRTAAGLALAPVAFALEGIGDVVPSWRLLASFAFLVLLVSTVAFLIWFQLLAAVGATAASAYPSSCRRSASCSGGCSSASAWSSSAWSESYPSRSASTW